MYADKYPDKYCLNSSVVTSVVIFCVYALCVVMFVVCVVCVMSLLLCFMCVKLVRIACSMKNTSDVVCTSSVVLLLVLVLLFVCLTAMTATPSATSHTTT